jgi:penicillin-binding protein 2
VVVVLWEHGGWGAGSAKLAAQVIQAYVDKQRRLENNVLQVEAQPAPQQPQAQPSADNAPKKTPAAKPTEVGAVWSDPAAPDQLGGRPLKAAIREAAKLPPSARAGHFFVQNGRLEQMTLVSAPGGRP